MTKADGYRRALRTLDEWEPFLLDRSGLASDPRWRVREAVAMALQRLGAADMRALLAEARRWAEGSDYECRAAAAALCEPSCSSGRRTLARSWRSSPPPALTGSPHGTRG